MTSGGVPAFDRRFFTGREPFTRVGGGALGGKASGLLRVRDDILGRLDPAEFPGVEVVVPTLTVLTTEVFDAFMARNGLYPLALSEAADERIALGFQQADLPAEFVGDLRALVTEVRTPLAVRSSSLLEDALDHPFAGVYGTKMIPNNAADVDTRFRRLVEAVKFVWASTFAAPARGYRAAIGQPPEAERMAVIIQEVVGERHGERYYPAVSGVGRSYNYYPAGRAQRADGVVSLALGLGKQIVDGGAAWTYAPPTPRVPPPYGRVRDLLRATQSRFWAVNMGRAPLPDPIHETEYLVEPDLTVAEADGPLRWLASTYDAADDRLRPGIGSRGPRVLDFAPLLAGEPLPLNAIVCRLLAAATEALGTAVEIEFALRLDPRSGLPARFGFLQVRPMRVVEASVVVSEEELSGPDVVLASRQVLGHGQREDLADLLYLKPAAFDAGQTRRMAWEIGQLNQALVAAGRPYLLLGFGRWGSSDPWLGVPVEWGQISGARVIVEATLPQMRPELSQGSHFFHNLIGFQVLYLTVGDDGPFAIDWPWLEAQETVAETDWVRHVRLAAPLWVKVDGQTGRGVVRRHAPR